MLFMNNYSKTIPKIRKTILVFFINYVFENFL